MIRTFSRTIPPPGNLSALRRKIAALPGGAMLESLPHGCGPGRYSIFTFDPVRAVTIDVRDRLLDRLAELCRPQFLLVPPIAEIPIFAGWIGHICYEAGYLLEPTAGCLTDFNTLSRWNLYDTLLIHDSRCDIWRVVAADLPSNCAPPSRLPARQRLDQFEQFIESGSYWCPECRIQYSRSMNKHPAGAWNYSREDYLHKCLKVLQYIRNGDVYQVNLSRRFRQPFALAPIELYEQLCRYNPATYAAYLQTANGAIISSSPELFLELHDHSVLTRPIKGTRPRRNNAPSDESARSDLASSVKDRAELDMIIDLERNDLGRVCETGSVEVISRGEIEVLPSVFHRTAAISGRLRSDADAFDLVAATFPGGSISGAPKIRAMQIIRELEPDPRGAYCGAIGYFSLNGDMQLNLAIRTMSVANELVDMHVGSGIVADSQPEQELAELDAKAAAMLQAIEDSCLNSSVPLEFACG